MKKIIKKNIERLKKVFYKLLKIFSAKLFFLISEGFYCLYSTCFDIGEALLSEKKQMTSQKRIDYEKTLTIAELQEERKMNYHEAREYYHKLKGNRIINRKIIKTKQVPIFSHGKEVRD